MREIGIAAAEAEQKLYGAVYAQRFAQGGHRQRAVTHIVHAEPLRGRHGMMTRVRLRLETGRTHQIRIHLAELGHPILGERVYARTPGAPRQALHAARLTLRHPVTGAVLTFTSPWPDDLANVTPRGRDW